MTDLTIAQYRERLMKMSIKEIQRAEEIRKEYFNDKK